MLCLCDLDEGFRRTVEDAAKKAVVKASGDIRPWQKSRWEREKDKREKAKVKLEVLEEKAEEEIATMKSKAEEEMKEINTKKRSAKDQLCQVKAKVGR